MRYQTKQSLMMVGELENKSNMTEHNIKSSQSIFTHTKTTAKFPRPSNIYEN